MQKANFQKLAQWFETLAEMDPAQRQEHLAMLAEEDKTLAENLRLMFEDQSGADRFFSAVDSENAPTLSLEGQVVCGYQIGELLGRGGMGAVYRATRQGEAFTKDFALKILPGAGHSPQHRQRFLLERKILATLDHPHIASLIDGGLLPDQTPFLVMEFINGTDLIRYAKQQELGLTARIQLFLQICKAVDYAHRQFVIHRDLKPENILVTADGKAKLLDFGIAKLTHDSTEEPLTNTFQRVLTPDYASPEQIRGETLSTATDVYSLGVVLYQLLTHQKPFQLKGKTAGEIQEIMNHTAPTKPSTQVTKATGSPPEVTISWSHKLKGELDTIILKAMRKDPSERYLSAEALAEDLRRYLNFEPILAKQPTWSYLAGKFVKRYRTAVLLTALIIMSLLGGLGATRQQALRAAEAQRKAEHEAEKATQLSQFLIDLFENANPKVSQGQEVSIKALVDQGQQKFTDSLDLNEDVKASPHGIFGRIYFFSGKYQDAERQLRNYQDQNPNPSDNLDEWFKNSLYFAETLIHGGKFEETLSHLEALLVVTEQEQRPLDAGITHNLIGLAHMRNGSSKQASHSFDKAVSLLQKIPGDQSKVELGLVYNHMGMQQLDLQKWEEAKTLFLKAKKLLANRRLDQIGIMTNLAVVHTRLGQIEQAIDTHLQVIEYKKAIHGEDAPVLAISFQNLAHAYLQQANTQQAKICFQKAIDHYKGEKQTLYHGFPHVGLSKTFLQEKRYQDAVEHGSQGLKIIASHQPKGSHLIANVQLHLGECYLGLKQFETATRLVLEAFHSLKNVLGANHPLTKKARTLLEQSQQNTLPSNLTKDVQSALALPQSP